MKYIKRENIKYNFVFLKFIIEKIRDLLECIDETTNDDNEDIYLSEIKY